MFLQPLSIFKSHAFSGGTFSWTSVDGVHKLCIRIENELNLTLKTNIRGKDSLSYIRCTSSICPTNV